MPILQHLTFLPPPSLSAFPRCTLSTARPHLPWVAPSEFYDLYPLDSVLPPKHPGFPEGAPTIAWHPGVTKSITEPLKTAETLNARRGLYATMSYVDSLVGQVLDELDRLDFTSSTVVSFVGDHGQQVGEHNLWVSASQV